MDNVWQRRAGMLICFTVFAVASYFALRYALGLILPFVVARGISLTVKTLSKRSRRLGGARAWDLFYLFLIWGAILLLFTVALRGLIIQGSAIIEGFDLASDGIENGIKNILRDLGDLVSRLPVIRMIEGASEYIANAIGDIAKRLIEEGGRLLTELAAELLAATPKTAISVLICIISSVYLTLDSGAIAEFFLGWLSEEGRARAIDTVRHAERAAIGYARAYLGMYAIAFCELFAGLLIMRIEYALALAALIALVDILPLASAGLILIPWGIWHIANGSYAQGIGMIALSIIMTVVRQIAEPRIVGKRLGMHPFATLAAMYVGLRVFGFWGSIILPMALAVAREMLEGKKKIKEKT